jgi:hypothetical protein
MDGYRDRCANASDEVMARRFALDVIETAMATARRQDAAAASMADAGTHQRSRVSDSTTPRSTSMRVFRT